MHVLLETLPGWPTAEEPSIFMWLLLLLGIPLAVGLVITAMGMAGRWRRTDPTVAAGAHTAVDADYAAIDVRRSMEQRAVGAEVENQQVEAGRTPDTAAIAAH